jgi:hypothetical protein
LPEIVSGRGYHFKRFDNGDGSLTDRLHVGHIHYKDAAGDLQDVDLHFTDEGTYWSVTKASFRLYVAKDFGASELIRFDNRYEGANHSIYFEPHSIWWVNADNKSQRQKWKDAQSVTGTLNAVGNKITWLNAFGVGVNYELTLLRSGFIKEIVLPSKPPTGGAPYANWAFGVVFRWRGDNLKVKAEGLSDWDDVSYYETMETLEVREVASGLKSYVHKAYGVDSRSPNPRETRIPLFWERRGGNLWTGKLIPSNWIENATYPIRLDASATYYSGAGDGRCIAGDRSTWASAQNDTSADWTNYTTGSEGIKVGCSYEAGPLYQIARGFVPVDTSGLDDAAVISAAILNLYVDVQNDGDNDAQAYIVVVQTSAASTSQLVDADYDQCGDSVDDPTPWSGQEDISSISAGGYHAWTLNAAGRAGISLTGITELGLREGHDAEDDSIVAVAQWTGVWLTGSEYADTARDPYLTVTYTIPEAISQDFGWVV